MVCGFFSRFRRKAKSQPPAEDDNPPSYAATPVSPSADHSQHPSGKESISQPKEEDTEERIKRLQQEKARLMEDDEEEAWRRDEAGIEWNDASNNWTANKTRENHVLSENAYVRYQSLVIANDRKNP
ncbi:hypothetical protein DL98DRAFT_534668 [Cadophora sp. DSE1049]|nr:hypothetical protein DL98DRAFT_534668 [Cadophora sp. DSE1049]